MESYLYCNRIIIFNVKKESIGTKIVVGVIVAILVLIIGNIVDDYMNPPEAIPVAQYNNEKVCPTNLYFWPYGDKTVSFSLRFQNTGDDGTLFVTIYSDKLLSRASDEEEFNSSSTKQWFMNSKQCGDFKFELKQKEDIKNFESFTVSFSYGCYEEIVGRTFYGKQHTSCCNYQKEQYSSNYILLNQICS